MKFRLVEKILTEKDWYEVPYKDSTGKRSSASFYATSEKDAKQLFKDLRDSTPDKRGNYHSKTKKQKFDSRIASTVNKGNNISGKIKLNPSHPNQATIEDPSLRRVSKQHADSKLGTPKDTLLHHKDANEDNMDSENLVAIDTTDTWERDVVHKFLHKCSFNTTSKSLTTTKLPITITVPIEEYDASGKLVQHTFTMEIR